MYCVFLCLTCSVPPSLSVSFSFFRSQNGVRSCWSLSPHLSWSLSWFLSIPRVEATRSANFNLFLLLSAWDTVKLILCVTPNLSAVISRIFRHHYQILINNGLLLIHTCTVWFSPGCQGLIYSNSGIKSVCSAFIGLFEPVAPYMSYYNLPVANDRIFN